MPFELENGTDYIGLEIADQIWLENDAPSGGIKWPKCCCQAPTANCQGCCLSCTPVIIPKVDLTVSWVGGPGPGCETIPSGGFPDGSGTMVYMPNGYSPVFLDGVFSGPSWVCSPPVATSADLRSALVLLTCQATVIKAAIVGQVSTGFGQPPGQYGWVTLSCYTIVATFTIGSDSCSPLGAGGGLSLNTYNTNPFGLTYNVADASPLNCQTEYFTSFTIAGPTYGTSTCCQNFVITGCNSLGVSGATVSVYNTNGGTLLAQAVTPLNGSVTLLWSGSCSVYVTVTSSRFVSYGQSLTLTQNGTTTIGLSITSGYHCMSECGIPVADTLNATFTIAGAQTFTFSGSAWTSTFDVSGHTYVATLTETATRSITRDGTTCGTINGVVTCPTSFSATMLPPAFATCRNEIGTATLTE